MAYMPDHRPSVPPSYKVHIAESDVSGRHSSSHPEYLVLKGFSFRDAAEHLYDVSADRIELPVSLEYGNRYDFILHVPVAEDAELLSDRVKRAMLHYFGVRAFRKTVLKDTWVISSDGKKVTQLSPSRGWGGSSSHVMYDIAPWAIFQGRWSVHHEGGIPEFCSHFERVLGVPIVDETGIAESVEIRLEGEGGEGNFRTALQEKTGLIMTKSQREIEMLVFELVEAI